jgi:thermitase
MKEMRFAIAATIIAAVISLAIPGVALAAEPVKGPVAELAAVSQSNDPLVDRQWALKQMPSMPTGTREILIAVLDTGIDTSHEDLAGKIVESVNFTNSKTDQDVNGHGTHIAGIIAADRNNGIGITGAAPNAKLLNVKIAEDSGTVWASNVAKGVIWATDRGARVINMSLAVPSKFQPLEEAIKYAWSHGVVVVAAAGNGIKSTTYPAAYSNVIAVAATTPDGKVWDQSNDGAFVTAYAPGVSILSTLPGSKYGMLSGSSMATAYVSAVAGQAFNQATDDNNDGTVNDEIATLARTLFPKPAN